MAAVAETSPTPETLPLPELDSSDKAARVAAGIAKLSAQIEAGERLPVMERWGLIRLAREQSRKEGARPAIITFFDGTVIESRLMGSRNPNTTAPSFEVTGGLIQVAGVEYMVGKQKKTEIIEYPLLDIKSISIADQAPID